MMIWPFDLELETSSPFWLLWELMPVAIVGLALLVLKWMVFGFGDD